MSINGHIHFGMFGMFPDNHDFGNCSIMTIYGHDAPTLTFDNWHAYKYREISILGFFFRLWTVHPPRHDGDLNLLR
jgi:hypothetical protein